MDAAVHPTIRFYRLSDRDRQTPLACTADEIVSTSVSVDLKIPQCAAHTLSSIFIKGEDMTREEQLESLLILNKKGGILDSRKIQHNPFFELYEYDGKQLCSVISNGEIHFNLVDCWERNAVAIYDLRTAAVFRGMLEAIFSISARIVDKGIYPEIGNVAPPKMRQDPGKLLVTKRELLNSLSNFNYDIDEHPWMASTDRQALFLFISNTLFRFIVFHELGHLYNEHGKRNNEKDFFEVDEMGTESPQGGIDSQAREIIADTFAFQKLVEFQRFHLLSQQNEPVGKLLSSHFMKNEEDLIIFISQMVFIYFYMMESPNWAHENPIQWTHPPAQFRLKTILASLLEHGLLSIEKTKIPEIIQKALFVGPSILSVMFETFPEYNWLQILDNPKYREHYELIFSEIPRWITPNENRWANMS
ncbi:hypothetical protein [Burkholderia stagnalis]|uniref:hypothetical protein n=1 Tax=Burkholderia stagnalis TaxID=1503054 RepID=UPI0012D9B829|nr:hypothetical protein [Burkholderia stagnalis]